MITPSLSLTATERVLPKLALDFTTASLDSRITFTRTTDATHPATYVNSSGFVTAATNNQPRFDYDPVTLACKGLLIEESRTNLALQSNDFTVAPWSKQANVSFTINSISSPDGNVNATKYSLLAATARSVSQIVATTIGQSYTFSIYLKAIVNTTINLQGQSIAITTAQGWQKISTTITATTSTTTFQFFDFSGSAGDRFYIYGAQVEAGAFATSYIPTTLLPLTRNADVATMTGTDFSDWFNASEGSIQIEADVYAFTSTTQRLAQIGDGTSSNRFDFYINASGNVNVSVTSGGSGQGGTASGNAISANTVFNIGYGYELNNTCVALDGGSTVSDTTVAMPITPTQMSIGYSTASGYLSGHMRKINYWPQRVLNAEVQAISK